MWNETCGTRVSPGKFSTMSAASKQQTSRNPERGEAAEKLPPVKNSASDEAKNQLTPEEQMALYEKELKENDWGHQPC